MDVLPKEMVTLCKALKPLMYRNAVCVPASSSHANRLDAYRSMIRCKIVYPIPRRATSSLKVALKIRPNAVVVVVFILPPPVPANRLAAYRSMIPVTWSCYTPLIIIIKAWLPNKNNAPIVHANRGDAFRPMVILPLLRYRYWTVLNRSMIHRHAAWMVKRQVQRRLGNPCDACRRNAMQRRFPAGSFPRHNP